MNNFRFKQVLFLVVASLVIISAVPLERSRRQVQNVGQNFGNRPNQPLIQNQDFAPVFGFGQIAANNQLNPPVSAPTTEAPSAVPTTASPSYLRCLENCRTTNEYNPVCGNDDINYHNAQRLTCAQSCGKSVLQVRQGTCRPL